MSHGDKETFLQKHIRFLLEKDKRFSALWQSMGYTKKKHIISLATVIENVSALEFKEIPNQHQYAADRLRRLLSCVPQLDMEYGKIPNDWSEFISNDSQKRIVYEKSITVLSRFLCENNFCGKTRIYGGIKPVSSLDRKLGEVKGGPRARKNRRDTWDAVRFRIVTKDVATLKDVAVAIWQYYLDDILRCRNYYMRNFSELNTEPYRAIHFEIEIERQRMVELQILTEARDLVGHFDHAPFFKRLVECPSEEHALWLKRLSFNANCYDETLIPSDAVRSPNKI